MRTIILFSGLGILFSFQSSAQSQDSLAVKRYYEKNTILWPGGLKYLKDGQKYSMKSLRNEIKFSPDAIHEYDQFLKNGKVLLAAFIVSEGLFVASLLVKDRDAKIGLLAGSLVAFTVSIPFSFSSRRHLSRAIWLHNKDVLSKRSFQ